VTAAGNIGVIRLNDFEALPAGPVPAILDFGGGLQASFVASATNGTELTEGIGDFFEFPISGSKHITSVTLQGTTFWSMTFNQELRAIGFCATDMSDWAGSSGTIPPLQVELAGSGGSVNYDLTPGIDPTTVANASVAFFGVVDADNPFNQITLVHPAHALTEDAVGIDNLMAVAVPEPETWLTMLTGLGLLGWRLRRNRTRQA